MPSAPRAAPSNITVAPRSGTPGEEPFAENENIMWVCPPAFWVVKAQSMDVASKPLPLTVPCPKISRKVAVWCMTVEDIRSKVNPPTLQRCGVGVDGLNIQGCAMSACVPGSIEAKVPVFPG